MHTSVQSCEKKSLAFSILSLSRAHLSFARTSDDEKRAPRIPANTTQEHTQKKNDHHHHRVTTSSSMKKKISLSRERERSRRRQNHTSERWHVQLCPVVHQFHEAFHVALRRGHVHRVQARELIVVVDRHYISFFLCCDAAAAAKRDEREKKRGLKKYDCDSPSPFFFSESAFLVVLFNTSSYLVSGSIHTKGVIFVAKIFFFCVCFFCLFFVCFFGVMNPPPWSTNEERFPLRASFRAMMTTPVIPVVTRATTARGGGGGGLVAVAEGRRRRTPRDAARRRHNATTRKAAAAQSGEVCDDDEK